MDELKKVVAFFSSEFMLEGDLHIYAGGLGAVAGSLINAAHSLKLPMVAVSIFWSNGYYDQEIGKHGMWVKKTKRERGDLIDTGLLLNAKICGTDVMVRVLEIPTDKYRVCPTYLLDTDILENNHDPLAKLITTELYQGGEDRRLAQKIILAKGVEALEKLGYDVKTYHLNEGFCLGVALELLQKEYEKEKNFQSAIEAVKEKIIFTTHTPEMAGNECHNIDNLYRMSMLKNMPRENIGWLGCCGENKNNTFSATAALLRMAKISNGVSKLHGAIAKEMWKNIDGSSPIISITNGVDLKSWQFPEFSQISSAEKLAEIKLKYKRKLLQTVASATGKYFSEEILTIVWARRFAEYKRPMLILSGSPEPEILPLLKTNKIQLIFAGKPFPEDRNMIALWNYIYQSSMNGHLPNVAILPGYEMSLSKILKGGADVWLNTPRCPREACGTSWMSAAYNGAVNISSRDGGMLEGIDGGFLFGTNQREEGKHDTDKDDFSLLIKTINKVVDLYYGYRDGWLKIALSGKEKIEKEFNAERMLREYWEKMYNFR